jgi:ribosomal protein L37AE/L43A
MKNKEFKFRCSKCNSNQTYIRIKTNELVCHKCGNIEKLMDKK